MALAIAQPSSLGVGPTGIAATAAAATGGVEPYVYTWEYGPTGFTPGTGTTVVSDVYDLGFVATGLANSTAYGVRIKVTDAAAATATSSERTLTTTAAYASRTLVWGLIGDSITINMGGSLGPAAQSMSGRAVVEVNRGVSGQYTGSFQPDFESSPGVFERFLEDAILEFRARGVQFVSIALGVNDAFYVVSAATFKANLAIIIARFTALGMTVILDYPTPRYGDDGTFNTLIATYLPKFAELVNGGTIRQGDTKANAMFIAAKATLISVDDVHPTTLGYNTLLVLRPAAFLAVADVPAANASAGSSAMSHVRHLPHLSHLPHVFGGGRRSRSFTDLMTAAATTAWWRMASTADSGSGGNLHPLTLAAAPNQTRVGAVANDSNACTRFVRASSQYATAADANDLDITGDFTLGCWFKPASSGVQHGLMSKGTSQYFFYVRTDLTVSFDIPFVTGNVFITTSTLAIGGWSHLVVTRSGNSWVFYLNGVSDKAVTDSSTMTANAEVLYVGGFNTTTHLTDGWLDEVFVIKGRAMTAADVLALYNASRKTQVTIAAATRVGAATARYQFSAPATVLNAVDGVYTGFEIDTGGGYIGASGYSESAVDQTSVDLTYGDTVTVADAWQVNEEPALTTVSFGGNKYLKAPQSGTVA